MNQALAPAKTPTFVSSVIRFLPLWVLLCATASVAQAQVVIKERVALAPDTTQTVPAALNALAEDNYFIIPADGPVQVRFTSAKREVIGFGTFPSLDGRSLKVVGPSEEILEAVGPHFRTLTAGTTVRFCGGGFDITFRQ